MTDLLDAGMDVELAVVVVSDYVTATRPVIAGPCAALRETKAQRNVRSMLIFAGAVVPCAG